MKVELRSDHVHISGYVNVVERYSRPMRAKDGRYFVEKIQQGVFRRAIENAGTVEVKHNHKRVLTSTADSSVKLKEDNIGLHCEADIYDEEIIQRAREKELVGWSFGFVTLGFEDKDSKMHGIGFERTITDMKLNEVSLIDRRAVPCYSATSVEVRAESEDSERLFRAQTEEIEYRSETDKKGEKDEDQSEAEEGTTKTDEKQAKNKPDHSLARAKIELLKY